MLGALLTGEVVAGQDQFDDPAGTLLGLHHDHEPLPDIGRGAPEIVPPPLDPIPALEQQVENTAFAIYGGVIYGGAIYGETVFGEALGIFPAPSVRRADRGHRARAPDNIVLATPIPRDVSSVVSTNRRGEPANY